MSVPLLTILEDSSLDPIFTDKKNAMILFTPNEDNKEEYRNVVR